MIKMHKYSIRRAGVGLTATLFASMQLLFGFIASNTVFAAPPIDPAQNQATQAAEVLAAVELKKIEVNALQETIENNASQQAVEAQARVNMQQPNIPAPGPVNLDTTSAVQLAEQSRVEQLAAANVTLCHATGSATNPYVMITINAAGAFNGHLGTGHQNGEDIIPPFMFNGQTYSQNWNAAGQAIFNNGCVPPVVTPTDVCPNIPGIQVTIPVGMVKNNAGNCVVPVIPGTPTDVCPNILGVQIVIPTGMIIDNAGNCVIPTVPGTPPVIGGQGGGVVLAAVTTVQPTPAPVSNPTVAVSNPEHLVNTGYNLFVNIAAVLALLGITATVISIRPKYSNT